jgi:trehalose 6-phosphate synthase/phosphatase
MTASLVDRMRAAEHLVLLLDYDGTLVPIVGRPELAVPDAALHELLAALVRRARTSVHVVSGRMREDLDRWVAPAGVALVSEHGAWAKAPGADWRRLVDGDLAWMAPVAVRLRALAAEHPGSVLEEKGVSFSWHYRVAPTVDERLAADVAGELRASFSAAPIDVIEGDKIVEVRLHGATKARAVENARRLAPKDALVVAVGDDRTDEDMFQALADDPRGVAVHVGATKATCAPVRVPDVDAVRVLLRSLLEP